MRMLLWVLMSLLSATPAISQQILEESGPVAHGSAGVTFPVTIGEFRRTHVIAYEADRSDMSANYSLAIEGGRINASVYIYPSVRGGDRTVACRTEFDGVGRAVLRAYPDAQLAESGIASAVADVPAALRLRSVHRMRVRFDGEMRDVLSETRLYCSVEGSWQVKYRATASAPYPPAVMKQFIAQGPWPGRTSAPASGTVAPSPT